MNAPKDGSRKFRTHAMRDEPPVGEEAALACVAP